MDEPVSCAFPFVKDVEAENFEGAYDMLEARLSEVCIEQAALKSDSKVNRNDVATFERLEAQKALGPM